MASSHNKSNLNHNNKEKSTKKKSQGRKNISIETVIRAISGTGGIVSQISDKLKCSRHTVYNYINKYEKVRCAYEDEKESILDVCEEGLFSKIYSQDFEAIKYYLDHKGKGRGYGAKDQFGKGPEEERPVAIKVQVINGRRDS